VLRFFIPTQLLHFQAALRPAAGQTEFVLQPLFFRSRLRNIKIDKANRLKNIIM